MHIRSNTRLLELRSLNYAWMSMFGQVGKIVYVYGNEVALVLLNWLGSKLDSRSLLGNDYTTFATLGCATESYMQPARVMDITIKSS